jgi:hypothetical protein
MLVVSILCAYHMDNCATQIPGKHQHYMLMNGSEHGASAQEEAEIVLRLVIRMINAKRKEIQEEESRIGTPVSGEDIPLDDTVPLSPRVFSNAAAEMNPTANPITAPTAAAQPPPPTVDPASTVPSGAAATAAVRKRGRPKKAQPVAAAAATPSPSSSSSSGSSGSATSGTPAASATPSTPSPAPPAAADLRPAVLFLDGEYSQIHIAMDGIGKAARCNNIWLFKFASSCSKTQQPNDVMKSFMVLHQFFRSYKFQGPLDPTQMVLPVGWTKIQQALKPIAASSRATFENYFRRLPYALDTAFSTSTVSQGYVKSGVGWPFNVARVLRNCPLIECHVKDDRFRTLCERIYDIAERGMTYHEAGDGGTVPDEVMEESVEEFFGPVHNNSGKATTDQPLVQWKAVLLNDEGTIATHAEVQRLKHAAEREARARKEAAAAHRAARREHGTLKRCDGHATLMCNNQTPRALLYGTNPGDWFKCDIRSCKSAFCPSCRVHLMTMHLRCHESAGYEFQADDEDEPED